MTPSLPSKLKRADVAQDGTLEPALTKWDLSILRALVNGEHAYSEGGKTAWQVAQAIHEEDVTSVRQTLDAMLDRGLVWRSWFDSKREPRVYMRTEKGDAYLKERSA